MIITFLIKPVRFSGRFLCAYQILSKVKWFIIQTPSRRFTKINFHCKYMNETEQTMILRYKYLYYRIKMARFLFFFYIIFKSRFLDIKSVVVMHFTEFVDFILRQLWWMKIDDHRGFCSRYGNTHAMHLFDEHKYCQKVTMICLLKVFFHCP